MHKKKLEDFEIMIQKVSQINPKKIEGLTTCLYFEQRKINNCYLNSTRAFFEKYGAFDLENATRKQFNELIQDLQTFRTNIKKYCNDFAVYCDKVLTEFKAVKQLKYFITSVSPKEYFYCYKNDVAISRFLKDKKLLIKECLSQEEFRKVEKAFRYVCTAFNETVAYRLHNFTDNLIRRFKLNALFERYNQTDKKIHYLKYAEETIILRKQHLEKFKFRTLSYRMLVRYDLLNGMIRYLNNLKQTSTEKEQDRIQSLIESLIRTETISLKLTKPEKTTQELCENLTAEQIDYLNNLPEKQENEMNVLYYKSSPGFELEIYKNHLKNTVNRLGEQIHIPHKIIRATKSNARVKELENIIIDLHQDLKESTQIVRSGRRSIFSIANTCLGLADVIFVQQRYKKTDLPILPIFKKALPTTE